MRRLDGRASSPGAVLSFSSPCKAVGGVGGSVFVVEHFQSPEDEAGAQRRRSTRVVQAIPLTVTGEDALGQAFRERTSTLLINCHGCRYQSKHYVPKNSFINMEVPHPDPNRKPRNVRARITWIQRPRTVRELFQVGAELEVPGNCWGVAFPPEDWFPWPEEDDPEVASSVAGETEAAAQRTPTAPPVASSTAPSIPAAAKPTHPSAAHPIAHAGAPTIPSAAGSTPTDKVRVMTRPTAGGEISANVARQLTRLIDDAKQQVTQAARAAATQAVAAETKQLLTTLNAQLLTAAQSAVEAAAAGQARKDSQSSAAETAEALRIALRHIEESRDASVRALAEAQQAARHDLAEHTRAEAARMADTAVLAEEALRLILVRIDEYREAATRAVSEQAENEIARTVEAGARTDKALHQSLRQVEESTAITLGAITEQAEKVIARTTEAGAHANAALQQTLHHIEETRQATLRALGEQTESDSTRTAEAGSHAETALQQTLQQIEASREMGLRALAEQAERAIARTAEAGSHTEAALQQTLQHIDESRDASLRALAEQAERAIARTAEAGTRTEAALQQTLQHIDESREDSLRILSEQARVEVGRVAELAIVELSGRIAATGAELHEQAAREVEAGRIQLAALEANLAVAISDAGQRYKTDIEERIETARMRLEELDREAGRVETKIAEAVEVNRTAWRQKFESDMAVVGSEWNDMIAGSVRSSTEGLAARLDEQAQGAVHQAQNAFAEQLETQLTAARAALNSLRADAQSAMDAIRETTEQAHTSSQQVLSELRAQTTATGVNARETFEALRSVFDASAAEARRNVESLRESLDSDAHRAESILSEIQQAAARVQDYSAQLEQLSRSTAAELQRRFETILATQSATLNQNAENIVTEVTGRLAPTFEEAGQRSVEKFLREMEEHLQKKLAPQFDRVTEVLSRLAAGEEHAEATLHAVRDRLRETSDQYVHEAVARMQSTITQLEHDYQASSRQALERLTAELDEKSTETTHTTFEALLKASDWYQKKAQTSMQAALERAVDQASTSLREKAAEMSSLFATELDHYSRSYAEHTEGLLEESSKKSVEATRGHLEEASATRLASFGDEALRVAERELRQLEAAGELNKRRLFADMEALADQSEKQVAESLGRIAAGVAEAAGRVDNHATETESRIAETFGRFEARIFETATRVDNHAAQTENRVAESLGRVENRASEAAAGLDNRAADSENRITESLGRIDAAAAEKERRAAQALERIQARAQDSEVHFGNMLAALEVAAGEVRAAEEAALISARERLTTEALETFDAFQARVGERMVEGVNKARRDLEVSLQPILESWRNERDSQHRDWINALAQLGNEALDQHQNRLANVSNSWMATSVATLSEHSQNVLDQLAQAAEQRLRETCAQVFSGLGDTLRQRMLGLSADIAPNEPPAPAPQKAPDKK